MTEAAPGDLVGDAPAVTIDAFLGGRVEAVQPAAGHHRAGLEAVLLGASLDSRITGTVVDLGSGAGIAGFCAAARCRHARVVLIEREPVLIDCARTALARPGNAAFAGRVRVVGVDISAPESERSAAGLGRDLADHVLLNPPFYTAGGGTRSPEKARASAHVLAGAGLDPWLRVAASVLKVGGDLTVVFRADGLADLLAAGGRRFGGIEIMSILPRADMPAHRILVRAVKGSRAPLKILPPLVLHGAEGNGFTPGVEAMLREGRALASVNHAWHGGRSRPSEDEPN